MDENHTMSPKSIDADSASDMYCEKYNKDIRVHDVVAVCEGYQFLLCLICASTDASPEALSEPNRDPSRPTLGQGNVDSN